MFFAILGALLLLLAGTTSLVAARGASSEPGRPAADPGVDPDTDADPDPDADLSAPERLALRLTDSVGRTAQAVDVLVDRRPSEDVLRERGGDPRARRLDLVVVGAGLLGLGLVMGLGVVLLLA